MIRLLKIEELPILLEGGREFFAEGKMPGGFDEGYFLNRFAQLIGDGIAHVAGSFDEGGEIHGALSWIVSPGLFSPAIFATEAFWFVRPQFRGRISEGVRLVSFYEASARAQGAHYLAMIHLMGLQPEKLESFYLRRGYVLTEKHFVKEL